MQRLFGMKSVGLVLGILNAMALGCGSDGDDGTGGTGAVTAASGGTLTGGTGGVAGGGRPPPTPPGTGGAAGTGGSPATPPGTGGAAGSAGAPVAGAPVAAGSGAVDGGTPGPGLDAGGSGAGGSGAGGQDASTAEPVDSGPPEPPPDSPPPGTVPIDPPVADDCITNVNPGDHTFNCDGVTYQVMVDELCTQFSCGLIFDVHGAMMSGDSMRNNNELHLLAPSQGYLTVHPTAAGAGWDWNADPPKLVDFMNRMIAAFHVDEDRVHMTGFSMGAGMTFWFLCNHTEAMASTAPVTGSSADQVTVVATGDNCIQSIDASWQPRVPILFMCGTQDTALNSQAATARTDGIVTRLGLTGGDVIDSGNGYTRRRWEDGDGMVFDFLEHDYVGGALAGHCIPGGGSDLFSCGSPAFHFGEVVLEWFINHPRRR